MFNSQLSVFVCVADCGSFSKAAEKLFLSSTAVMKQINALEKHLDLTLIHRTNHGISLTAAGEAIYKDARFLFDYSQKAIENARQLEQSKNAMICVGTSMLNPCKAFMDLWYEISDRFPQYKIHIVPFEDSHLGILNEISALGDKFDFLVAACDSQKWLQHCNFLPLGRYRQCLAIPFEHRLVKQKHLSICDLYGETLMMVKRGDSPMNDQLRDTLEQGHPLITIKDAPNFYDIEVFNECAKNGYLLSSLECWSDIHPGLVSVPTDWGFEIPYGLLYAQDPPEDIRQLVKAIASTSSYSAE